MKRVAIVTTSRADIGLYRPVIHALNEARSLKPELWVSGAHLSQSHGGTIDAVEDLGYPIRHRVEGLTASDTPSGIASSIGLTTQGFARALSEDLPDVLLVLGDRFEMLGAVLAALPFNLPVAHIHGGEITAGATDDAVRHAITKLSHLHFAATEEHARRLRQLGEDPNCVHVTGSPAVDAILTTERLAPKTVVSRFGVTLDPPPLLVTYHPTTRRPDHVEEEVGALIEALSQVEGPIIITRPNADTYNGVIHEALKRFAAGSEQRTFVENLGSAAYYTVLSKARAMVGNSSSGLIEAPSFALPVVNIGDRQHGRTRGENVVDVEPEAQSILDGIELAISDEKARTLGTSSNPYGDGKAAPRITEILSKTDLEALVAKRFRDLPLADEAEARP